ncbi:MAG: hypothetical protein JWQ42_5083 [Edaphobacter sp.]|jgi:hypothetical protein|nr:hypothetical protein [Edaphobacter sp.]
MRFWHSHKVAVITGATGGIGSAVAEMLSGTGYRMALSGSLGCHSPELSYVVAYNHKALKAAKSDTTFRRKFFTQMDNALLNGFRTQNRPGLSVCQCGRAAGIMLVAILNSLIICQNTCCQRQT